MSWNDSLRATSTHWMAGNLMNFQPDFGASAACVIVITY